MEIINPNQIGRQISQLIADSTEKFYAVTAWLDLSNWTYLLEELKKARERGVTIKIYFREIKEQDFKLLVSIGIQLFQVKRLHTKFYMNEKEIIVSSMNLIEGSDLYSIDIGMHYNDEENYNKFYHYFIKHIQRHNSDKIDYLMFDEEALKELKGYLAARFTDSKIKYAASSNYLFSKDLLPVFHIFITPSVITLKYPIKNPTSEQIKELTNKIELNLKNECAPELPHDNYDYCTWEISIANNSTIDLVDLITRLRKLE